MQANERRTKDERSDTNIVENAVFCYRVRGPHSAIAVQLGVDETKELTSEPHTLFALKIDTVPD